MLLLEYYELQYVPSARLVITCHLKMNACKISFFHFMHKLIKSSCPLTDWAKFRDCLAEDKNVQYF